MSKVFIKKFKNGTLNLEQVLLKNDGTPIVFICTDLDKKLYLCVTIADWEIYECIISQTDLEIIEQLVMNKIDILNAMSFYEECYDYKIDENNTEHLERIDYKTLIKDNLISKDIYLICSNKEKTIDYIKVKQNMKFVDYNSLLLANKIILYVISKFKENDYNSMIDYYKAIDKRVKVIKKPFYYPTIDFCKANWNNSNYNNNDYIGYLKEEEVLC